MKLRLSFKLEEDQTFQLCRLVATVGTILSGGYSHCFSIGLKPTLVEYWHGYWDYCVVLFGVRLRYTRRYGGIFV